ncbi:MAG: elongator complex protein 3 [Chitinophagales bacterium]
MKKHAIIPIFIPHRGCSYNCVYCNQKSITGQLSRISVLEIDNVIKSHLQNMPDSIIPEIAFYGGSFTALPMAKQQELLKIAEPYVVSGSVSGIRISTRPDAIDNDILELLASYRVKVIELGVQSLDREILRISGRPYEPGIVAEVSKLIKQKGFVLGHQIMIGLPGSDPSKEIDTANKVIEIKPHLARIYPAIVLQGTRLAEWYRDGLYQPIELEEAVNIVAILLTMLEKAGIKIIRMGLQPSTDLVEPGNILAGPFHPSFGELVQAEVFRLQAEVAITRFQEGGTTRRLNLYVHSNDLSKMIGHYRNNIRSLTEIFKLESLKVIGLNDIEKKWVGVGGWEEDSPRLIISRHEFHELYKYKNIGY